MPWKSIAYTVPVACFFLGVVVPVAFLANPQ